MILCSMDFLCSSPPLKTCRFLIFYVLTGNFYEKEVSINVFYILVKLQAYKPNDKNIFLDYLLD